MNFSSDKSFFLGFHVSTPLKSTSVDLNKNLGLSPIQNRSQQDSDVDSAYFSSLKGSSPSVSSSWRSVSDISSFSLKKFQEHKGLDILAELFNKSIFHIIQKILNYLHLEDYMKLLRVSKLWNQIVKDDLKHNRKRKSSVKQKENYF